MTSQILVWLNQIEELYLVLNYTKLYIMWTVDYYILCSPASYFLRTPTLVVYAASVWLSISRDSPKSAILHTSCPFTNTFRAAKSLWPSDNVSDW